MTLVDMICTYIEHPYESCNRLSTEPLKTKELFYSRSAAGIYYIKQVHSHFEIEELLLLLKSLYIIDSCRCRLQYSHYDLDSKDITLNFCNKHNLFVQEFMDSIDNSPIVKQRKR